MLVFDEGYNKSDLWKKMHEKWETIHILGNFWRHVPVHPEHVPVHVRFWSFWANMYRYRSGVYRTCDALFPISTSFLNLAITCSFLIRFE